MDEEEERSQRRRVSNYWDNKRTKQMTDTKSDAEKALDELIPCLKIDRAVDASNAITIIRKALKREPVGWQPIGTAPRDGTKILVLWLDGDAVSSSRWQVDAKGKWFWDYSVMNPTHWMPLPEPPEKED